MGIKFCKPKFTKNNAAMAIGAAASGVIVGPVHEGGHALAAKLLGYNPSFGYGSENGFTLKTYVDGLPESTLDDRIVLLGAPAAEYASAFALSMLSGGIENHLLKISAKMTSTFLGMMPLEQTLISYFTSSAGEDYQRLAQNGVGYEITIPATLAMGLMNAYVAWKNNLPSNSRRNFP